MTFAYANTLNKSRQYFNDTNSTYMYGVVISSVKGDLAVQQDCLVLSGCLTSAFVIQHSADGQQD